MSSLKLTVRKRVPWGLLVYTLPWGYVFWAPYQYGAGWLEWTVTTLGLLAMLALFLVGATYGEGRRLITGICAAMLLTASGFMAYRPSGGLYFTVVATFVPAAVGGSIGWSMTVLAAVAALFGMEWCLLYLDGSQGAVFPLLIAAAIFISGIGAAFMLRRAGEIQRHDKVSERERIAQDLHDVVGHSLSSLALKAELARRVFHTDPVRALTEISDVERIARRGIEELRGAIQGYFAGDIQAELDRMESVLKAADIHVERRCERLEMPAASERVLALILREAVTNILQHSQATACRLALFQAEGAYQLEISDDGRGGAHEEGIGMRSIRTRAEALGGTTVWTSTVGTQLRVSLPICGSEAA
jgi:two-component system sensor histidine kinase DesK